MSGVRATNTTKSRSSQIHRRSRLSARSWGGLRWFRRTRRITFHFLPSPLLVSTIGRRDVLEFSGIEGEGDGTLSRGAYKSARVLYAGPLQSYLVCQTHIHHGTKLTVYAYRLSRHIVSNLLRPPLMRSGTYNCFILSKNTSYSRRDDSADCPCTFAKFTRQTSSDGRTIAL